ncbi:MAG: hypothetical protein JST42_01595 [Bacteroidetes bacterium]|nr:hypothetical protein [Bacteroidota bacterium]
MNERINDFYSRGFDDRADEEKMKVEVVRTRLIHLQCSLDSLEKVKK